MDTQNTESDKRLMAEQAKNRAARFYRLAFLLTNDRARSLEVTLETIDSEDGTNSFFSSWLLAWSQRLLIAKALAGIRGELAESARRTACLRPEKREKPALPSRNPVIDPGANGTDGQMEGALFAIDLFPRCALLLTVFEGISAEDAATILDVDRDLVRKGRIIGLQELTRKLAAKPVGKSAGKAGQTNTAGQSYLGRELQHA